MNAKVLISLFDHTGNASRPYREDGWLVKQVDIQDGIDILEWDYVAWFYELETEVNMKFGARPEVGIIAMIPCDNYAVCGAKHFKAKDADGRTAHSQKLVARTKEIIDYFKLHGILKFWMVENPRTRIHTLNPWLKPRTQRFNPCDFAGYDPVPNNSRYNKDTWLFGEFNKMEPRYLEPFGKEYPGFRNLGGKSLKTKNARSVTPLGFCYAFKQANS